MSVIINVYSTKTIESMTVSKADNNDFDLSTA